MLKTPFPTTKILNFPMTQILTILMITHLTTILTINPLLTTITIILTAITIITQFLNQRSVTNDPKGVTMASFTMPILLHL